jgi:hypothetical protein
VGAAQLPVGIPLQGTNRDAAAQVDTVRALQVGGDPADHTPERTGKRGRLRAGHQHRDADADLRVLSALGVHHICSALPSRSLDAAWSVEGLSRLRERVERFGIRLEMIPLPLSNAPLRQAESPNLLLGRSPQRDREIDAICQMIRNARRSARPGPGAGSIRRLPPALPRRADRDGDRPAPAAQHFVGRFGTYFTRRHPDSSATRAVWPL